MSLKIKKLLIVPFFGPLPEWYDKYEPPKGYDFLIDQDLEGFKKRVKDVLGFDSDIQSGTGKPWDFRCALGELYKEELLGYTWYGHTDFDCVYTDYPDEFVTDEMLNNLDVFSNHYEYVNGCFSLYRNISEVTNLFKKYLNWKEKMLGEPNGWVEQEYSRILESSGLRYKYDFQQGNPYDSSPNLKKIDGRLYQDGKEIFMFHFRRSKRWPL